MTILRARPSIRQLARSVGVTTLLSLAACDFSVTNPGPVQDEFLNAPAAHEAVVNGMGRALADALNWIAYTGGAVSREITAAGSIGSFGVTLSQREGLLTPDESNAHWSRAQKARWLAENGVERMRAALGEDFESSSLAAEALLYAGYSNRLLGENMCEAVIDGGAPQARAVYFERAEAGFTGAHRIATTLGDGDVATAALAGRASVRAWQGDWSGAVADARQVPEDFEYHARYFALEQNQYNRIFFANANQPYRAHSVVGTFYEQYYLDTQDPRTPWSRSAEYPVGDVGQVPWYFQTKYAAADSPINLSSGREMRLIEAEALLRNGNWQAAMEIINDLRTDVGVRPVTAGSLSEAWTALKRERGIELWLEGRRLGDLYRWQAENAPGAVEDMSGRDLCFPISESERETNPNLRG